MKELDVVLLKKFLKLSADTLSGNWLLVGGTLLPALGLQVRTTVDIDIIGLGPKELAQNLELMAIADKLGLSIETINQAAAFYLKQIEYTDKDLIVLLKGKKATINRPSVELYFKLKILRLSESDLIDCQHYFNFCLGHNDVIDRKRILRAVEKQMSQRAHREIFERFQILTKLLMR